MVSCLLPNRRQTSFGALNNYSEGFSPVHPAAVRMMVTVREGIATADSLRFLSNLNPILMKNYASKALQSAAMVVLLALPWTTAAQDGLAGINEANQQVRSYFDAGTDLMYAVGAILGLIGAVKVYQKWNAGDPDTGKVAAAWFGSCVFLVVVATVIQSFFGI